MSFALITFKSTLKDSLSRHMDTYITWELLSISGCKVGFNVNFATTRLHVDWGSCLVNYLIRSYFGRRWGDQDNLSIRENT